MFENRNAECGVRQAEKFGSGNSEFGIGEEKRNTPRTSTTLSERSRTGKENEVKLIGLQVENIFGVKAVDLKLNGNSAVLTGPNRAGKTSVLDAILLAIGKLKDGNPLKLGERKGKVTADFGKFVVERSWDANKSTPIWKITGKDGKRYSTAKDLFDTFIDDLTVQPKKWIEQPAKDRIRSLYKVLGIDLDEYESRKKELYNERTQIGRDRKRAEGTKNGIYETHLDLVKKGQAIAFDDQPETELSFSELNNELAKLREQDQARNKLEHEVRTLANRIESFIERKETANLYYNRNVDEMNTLIGKYKSLDKMIKDSDDPADEIAKVKAEIARLQKKLAELEKQQNNRQNAIETMNELKTKIMQFKQQISTQETERKEIDNELVQIEKQHSMAVNMLNNTPEVRPEIETLQHKMNALEKMNASIRTRQKYQEALDEYSILDREYEEYTEQLSAMEARIQKKLARADLPSGLEINDNDILLNGVKFERLSTMQKLELALQVGMRIKQNGNGKDHLKLVTMDISPMDEKSRAEAIKLIEKHGFQGILEIASIDKEGGMVNGTTSFYINDGEVK
jgi:hypothetical protein